MNSKDRANAITQDILHNHLPRVVEGCEKDYVDENQIAVIFDHAVRARILREQAAQEARIVASLRIADQLLDDIDTCSDMHKPDLNDPYVKNVMKLCVIERLARRNLLAEITT